MIPTIRRLVLAALALLFAVIGTVVHGEVAQAAVGVNVKACFYDQYGVYTGPVTLYKSGVSGAYRSGRIVNGCGTFFGVDAHSTYKFVVSSRYGTCPYFLSTGTSGWRSIGGAGTWGFGNTPLNTVLITYPAC